MSGVVSGLAVVWAVIGLGWLLGRTKLMPTSAQDALNRLVYLVGLPALVFLTLLNAHVGDLLGAPLIVAAVSGLAAAGMFAVIGRWGLRLSGERTLIGTMGASLANAAYLGVPLATYVLGSSVHVAPVIMFQVGFLTPTLFVLADILAADRRPTVRSVAITVGKNPLVWAAVAGAALSVAGLRPPAVILDVVDVVASSAVPCILIAFGLSFVGQSPKLYRAATAPIALATVIKLVIQPAIGYLLARYGLGLGGSDLFAVTCMAGLPTVQNAYLAAHRVGAGQDIARGVVMATTVLVIPTFLIFAFLFT